jgi:hypothetical protein
MRLKDNHPALERAITIHPRTVKPLADYGSRLLKPASGNAKLGAGSNVVTKGKWSGMAMYTLTLEERATCSRTCQQWDRCFGNNMGFAHRISSSEPELLELRLNDELEHLSRVHPNGFVIRLHVLGDFFSTDYVDFWANALRAYPALHLFGYTHRTDGPIADAIALHLQNDRAWIRWSDKGGIMSANVHGEGITCPEQIGKTASCLTCGLCWTTTKAIAFIAH